MVAAGTPGRGTPPTHLSMYCDRLNPIQQENQSGLPLPSMISAAPSPSQRNQSRADAIQVDMDDDVFEVPPPPTASRQTGGMGAVALPHTGNLGSQVCLPECFVREWLQILGYPQVRTPGSVRVAHQVLTPDATVRSTVDQGWILPPSGTAVPLC